MAEGTLPELAVQQIISCDQTFGECQGEDLPTAFDYVQNTADPQTSNVKGRTGHCEWDGNQVASVTSWRYAVPPCIGGAGENRDEAALAAVVAKSGPVSICVNAASWDSYTSGVFTGTSTRRTMKWIIACSFSGFDTAASIPYWKVRNSWSTDWCEAGFIMCAQQCAEWPEALANSWVRQRITCECRGLDDKASGDVSEESGTVWLVLVVEHGFPRRCLVHHRWQFVTFERAATRELRHGRP